MAFKAAGRHPSLYVRVIASQIKEQTEDAAQSAAVIFATPAIFSLDLESIPVKKWRKPGAKLSDYFNYGTLCLYIFAGLNEETWKRYALIIRESKAEFSDMVQQEILARGGTNGDSTGPHLVHHANLDLNFNLPNDMGGLGLPFNRQRYSRV